MYRYLGVALLALSTACYAQEPPRAALGYRWRLTAEAQRVWGPGAPVPAMAAQIHQESAWRPDAKSPVGALGLTQFMPGTADWISGLYPKELGDNQPMNPGWAIRAMVYYNYWLFKRVPEGPTLCDKWWFTLRSYNGGLGHLRKEAKLSTSLARESVDAQCGKASRSRVHCNENLGYPRRILITHQPRYRAWGQIVECSAHVGPQPTR